MGKVKGSIFLKVIKSVKKHGCREQVPAEMQHYLDSHLLVSSWFEEEHYLALMKLIAARVPNPGMDVWEFMGRDSARVDYEGMYRSFIENRTPGRALAGFKILWPLRHDTGEVSIENGEVNGDGSHHASVELAGYTLVADEIYRSIQGTIWQTLHMAGAQDIRIRRASCPTRGDRVARWELDWRQ